MSKPNDLVQRTLDVLVLKMLALEPMDGWPIRHRLREVSADALQVSHGSLYPALHKLEYAGLVTAERRVTDNNRRAKFYSLTRLGRQYLKAETLDWLRLSSASTAVLQLKEVQDGYRAILVRRPPASARHLQPASGRARAERSAGSCIGSMHQ